MLGGVKAVSGAIVALLAACEPSDSAGGFPDAGPTYGFVATFFDGYRLPVGDRTVPGVAFTWDGSPAAGVGADRFSARFTAVLDAPVTGTYRFATVADDGVRLWVGDQLVIDDWRPHFPERHEGVIDLAAGPVPIRLDYFEADLGAEVHLYWTPPGGVEEILGGAHVQVASSDDDAPKPPYANPVIAHDCPDPGVARVGDDLYLSACTGGTFPVRVSRDLVAWEDAGFALLPDGKPTWAANGSRNWAPELHVIGDDIVAYYTSVNAADVLSIGAAVIDRATGAATDLGAPLVEHPDGVIDATLARDRDGALYLVYKIDGNAHGRPTPILMRRLADDGLSFAPGSTEIELLRNDPATWEGGVVEAPWIVERDGLYYLFYSGNVYDHRYRTGVARATSITGPYEKHGAPILGSDATWAGPGHGSVVPVGDRLYFVYHAWYATPSGEHDAARGRVVLVDEIGFEDGWPRIHDGTPSEGLVPWPGG